MMFSQEPNVQQGCRVSAGRSFGLLAKGLWPFAAHLFPHLRRVKIIWRNAKHRGKNEKLRIGDVPKTDFNLTQGGTADVEAGHLATRCEFLLAEFQLATRFPNLWPYNIGRMYFTGHGSTKSSLTLFEKLVRGCYARVTEQVLPMPAAWPMGMKSNNSNDALKAGSGWRPPASGAVFPAHGSWGMGDEWTEQSKRAMLEIRRSILRKLSLRLGKENCFRHLK
jgi:hypothetical protein